jgi:hypothetical protein
LSDFLIVFSDFLIEVDSGYRTAKPAFVCRLSVKDYWRDDSNRVEEAGSGLGAITYLKA